MSMTLEHLAKVFDWYRKKLAELGVAPVRHAEVRVWAEDGVRTDGALMDLRRRLLEHGAWMVEKALAEFLPAKDHEKANRWLGWVQCDLAVAGVYTIDHTRDHNRSEDEGPKGVYLSGQQAEALRNVVKYLWGVERADAEQHVSEGNPLAGHVFVDLVVLDNVLQGTDLAPEAYLDSHLDTQDEDEQGQGPIVLPIDPTAGGT